MKDADVVYAAGFDPDKLTAAPTPAASQPAPSASRDQVDAEGPAWPSRTPRQA